MSERIERRQKQNERHRQAIDAALAAPTDHSPQLIRNRDQHERLHGSGAVARFNSAIAVLITRSVGTMWAAYLFVLIGLVSLPQAWAAFMKGDTVTGVAWLSQSFLQLVLLPIIIVGQNVISASQDARAEADHVTLTVLHSINIRQLKMLEQQEAILKVLSPKT